MDDRRWRLAHGQSIILGPRSVLMGILNVTPDSFSDGGRFLDRPKALDHAARMIGEGAEIIDVGGESTRPGADAVSASEEQDRVLPIIEELAKAGGAMISIDTYRAETARLAVEAGAHIINDVWGLHREREIAGVAAELGAGLIAMHTGRGREKLPDAIEDQKLFLGAAIAIARDAGVADEQIVLDPGFGFAKEVAEENLDLMSRFGELHALGFPLAVGTSRKRFVGTVTGREGDERDVGTTATNVLLRMAGAVIFRVHNVAFNRDALSFADAMVARLATPEH